MFSWKKEAKVESTRPTNQRNPGQRSKAQLPLFDIPDVNEMNDDFGGNDDDDDDDLEAELEALQAGLDVRKVVSRRRLEESLQPKKQVVEMDNSEDESDAEVDENDPELLAELSKIETSPSDDNLATRDPPVKPKRRMPEIDMKREVPVLPSHRPEPIKLRAAPPPPPPTAVSSSIPVSKSATNIAPTQLPVSSATAPHGESIMDLLAERLSMYKTAHQNAVAASDTSKTRRLDRGMKTLESMLKTAKTGRPINEDDIPPPVAISSKPPSQTNFITQPNVEPMQSSDINIMPQTSGSPPPLPPRIRQIPDVVPSAPPLTPPQVIKTDIKDEKTIAMLTERRNQYRQAAVTAKQNNDLDKTRDYVKIAKKFDMIIDAIEQGKEVDLKGMPPPPPPSPSLKENGVLSTSNESKMKSLINVAPPINQRQQSVDRDAPIEIPTEEVPDDPSVFNPPPPPANVLEALQQRLAKYKSAMEEAGDNPSKARRMGRIVKQYEDTIKCYKAGKPVDLEELPTPPGFAPIPTGASNAVSKPVTPQNLPQAKVNNENVQGLKQSPAASQVLPSNVNRTNQVLTPPSQSVTNTAQKPTQKSPLALHEKQLAAILERQKSFKDAALDAKKRGDIQAAKEYLRVAKGFEPMIQAAKCGLPVNMDSLPIQPKSNAENTFEIISKEDCEPAGDRQELFEKLDKELLAQIEMCVGNRLHFSKLGDVQNTQKFETMLLNTKKDLSFVRHLYKRGEPVPRFHYETKTFSIVRVCTDLGNDDLEMTIIKGINYSCPNPAEVDTYIKFEFPFPVETPQKDKTPLVKNTNNPEYNAVFKLSINRKSRNCLSVFKRKGAKLEVWSKGGFLRSDILLGTATVKLTPLETRCILHDSFDLMEGRKPIGGKIEAKLRIREPLLTKQVDTMCEKWLIISESISDVCTAICLYTINYRLSEVAL